jgi:hypothetical protein
MESFGRSKPLDLYKIQRSILFSFFRLTCEFLDPVGERGGFL